jgi:hypothetical protein
MGMYSTVDYSDVEIKDKDGLIKAMEELKKNPETAGWVECLKINNSCLDFYGLDGHKIISYWYDSFCLVLKAIAPYVEGSVFLNFENHDEGGYFTFEDGNCNITYGHMDWTTIPVDQILNERKERRTND